MVAIIQIATVRMGTIVIPVGMLVKRKIRFSKTPTVKVEMPKP